MSAMNFYYWFANIFIVISSLFIIDLILPFSNHQSEISEIYRPLRAYKSHQWDKSTTVKSKEVVMINTQHGLIKVYVRGVGPIKVGDPVIVYKSRIFRYVRAIHKLKEDKTLKTANFMFGYFKFIPFSILILSIVVLRLKMRSQIENFGGGLIVLTGFAIFVLLKDIYF